MIKLTDILSEIKIIQPNQYPVKTTAWWLNQLDEPYRTKALNNWKRSFNDEQKPGYGGDKQLNKSEALRAAFIWMNTSEGPEYWKKVYDLNLQEIKINRPPKVWDLDKPGVKFDNIKVEDILHFTLYQPWKEKVKQKVTSIDDRYIRTHDLTDKDELKTVSGEDVWTKNDIETYYQLNKVDEIKVVNPNVPTHFPIKVTKENWNFIADYLSKKGYTTITGRYLKDIPKNIMDERLFTYDTWYISRYFSDNSKVTFSNPEIFEEEPIRQTISPIKNQNK